MFRGEETGAPMNSQFAIRIAVLGSVALVVFAVIFFRLWYLEVLSGEAYLKEADANRVREIKQPAPRGEILDTNGRVLVDNRTELSLQVRPDELFTDKQDRNRELRKLGDVAGMSMGRIKREIREQTNLLPSSPVTLDQEVKPELVFSLRERQDEFPGVNAGQVYVRNYPEGNLGAHLFGFVSEINEEQLKEPTFDGLDPGDRIGATGIEAQYDSVLRGRSGATRVQVDAFGEPRGKELSSVEPKAGESLVLTLDEKVQRAGEDALASYGLPGAFVVMRVDDGAILGMGSYPTFDPNVYTPPVSTRSIEALVDDETAPLTNRAIQSAYVTGSTFKLVTATAGLEEGLITPGEVINDGGFITVGDQEFENAGRVSNGPVDMIDSLRVSSDVYYYLLGQELENAGQEGLQKWATNYGFGSDTGVDLPDEVSGLVPTAERRNDLYEEYGKPDSECGTERIFDPARDCFETVDRPWSVGDNINLSVGQGDLGASPLQLAVAYAAMANGGEVVRPHLADRAENALGQTTHEYDPAPKRSIDLAPETRSTIMEGLREAAMEPGGTSYSVMGGFPFDIAGKTGTAEKTDQEDQSWYAAIAPFDDPEIVVIVTIERGGFGAETAAPAAKAILSQYFKVGAREIEEVAAEPTTAD